MEGKDNLLTVTVRPDVVMTRGSGMFLWDSAGKKYLDFIGGWAVNCLGHSPQVLVDAIRDQAERLINASPSFYNDAMLKLAGKLAEISGLSRAFFVCSGSEANESAIKLSRKYGQKMKNGAFEIITNQGSFHGRTLATMSASGKAAFENLFEPKVPGFVKVPLNDVEMLKRSVSENTCAVMIESIQGEGGVNPVSQEYVNAAEKLAHENGLLLIFDEVQTGIGRTGTLFGFEHYGVVPDIVTLAKGLGGGFPVSAMLCREELNIFEPGDQGGTYSGQPLAMAAGLAVLEEIVKPGFLEHVVEMEKYIKGRLQKLESELNIENIRGKGLLLAFNLKSGDSKRVVDACLEKGLILNAPQPGAIRLMPALTVSREEIDMMFEILIPVISEFK